MRDWPLSYFQLGVWILEQRNPGTPLFNFSPVAELSGPLDIPRLRLAWERILDRHEALRTGFQIVDGEPVQRVDPTVEADLPLVDLSTLPLRAREESLEEGLRRAGREVFDLAVAPLVRLRLFRLGADDHRLLICLHHLVLDGVSVSFFVEELAALYAGLPLPPVPLQYPAFAAWQRERLESGDWAEHGDYWLERLGGSSAGLDLWTDRLRGAARTFRAGCNRRVLPPPLAAAVRALRRERGSSLYRLLLAAFEALVHRLTGNEETVLGIPFSSRVHPAGERLVGFCSNTLPLVVDLGGDPRFLDLLERVDRELGEAARHRHYPAERILEELDAQRRPAPASQVVFVQDFRVPEQRTGDLRWRADLLPRERTQFDLTVYAGDSAEGPRVSFEYDAELFESSFIARLAACFECLLASAVAQPELRISELEVLPQAERRQVVAFGRGAPAPSLELSVCEVFAARAAAQPDAVAVVCAERHETYGELRRRAGRLAGWLRVRGVGLEDPVGVLGERGPELVASLLAIQEAGGIYLPLEPGHPDARLTGFLNDSGARVLLASARLAERARVLTGALPRPVQVLVWDEAPPASEEAALPSPGASRRLATLFYTSGSTGSPKGVMVEHAGVLNHLWAKVELLGLGAGSAVAQNASQGFDISVWQMLAPLLVGGRVVVYGAEEAGDVAGLLGRVEFDGVTVLETVPSLLETMLAELPQEGGPRLARLEYLISNAETLPLPVARRWLERFPHVALVNAYGPTECSDDVTHQVFRTVPELGEARVGVGRPIAGMRVWVLDRGLRPVPAGWPGQIAFSGVAVGRGYLGDAGKTARTFVPDPWTQEPGGRLYLTGDQGRWGSGGNLEFLGRLDRQVKVRGHRIEPGEVEAALGRLDGVRQAVVEARPDRQGRMRLLAWVAAEGRLEGGELRERLRERLPPALLPEEIVLLAALPLNRNGKVDRRALREPERAERPGGVGPRDELEERIAAIWREVLRLDRVGVHDSFFELGGDSLRTVQVRSRLQRDLAVELPLRALFDHPTVEALAQEVRSRSGFRGAGRREPIPRLPEADHHPLSHTQTWQWFAHQMGGWRAWHPPRLLRLEGGLHVPAFRRALQALVERHEALRTAFFEVDGEPVQAIRNGTAPACPLVDLGALDPAHREEELAAVLRELAMAPFDLARPPLLRAVLLRHGKDLHTALLGLPHIVSDEWTEDLLIGELARLYNAFREGRPSPLSPLPVRYVDFVAWLDRRLASPELDEQRRFWLDRFGDPPSLELPPGQGGAVDGPVAEALDAGCVARLREISAARRATLFTTLLAGCQALLARWTGREDLAVGTVVSGRIHPDLEGIAGVFLNPLPLRADLSGDPEFGELVDRARAALLQALENQGVPFHAWLGELRRRSGRSDLMPCSAWVTLASPPPPLRFDGLAATARSYASAPGVDPAAGGGLLLHAQESDDGIVLTLLGEARPWAGPFLTQLRRLLQQVSRDPDLRMSQIDLLEQEERRRLVELRHGRPLDPPLLRLLAAWREGGVALLAGDGEILAGGGAELLDPWELARTLARLEVEALVAPRATLAALDRVLGRAVDPGDLALGRVVAVGGPVRPGELPRLGDAAAIAFFLPLGTAGAGLWAERRDGEEGEFFRGRPLPGHRIDVLDRWGQPVPVGFFGEIHADGEPAGLRGRWREDGALEARVLSPPEGDIGGIGVRSRPPLAHPYVAPRTALERRLASAWERVLGISEVGIHDRFFDLGGTPALAAEVSLRLAEADVACPAPALTRHGTVAELAAALTEQAALSGGPAGDDPVPVTPLQRALLSAASEDPARAADAFGLKLLRPLEPEALQRALAAVAERHPALRARFPRRGRLWVQELRPAGTVPLAVLDLRGLPPEERPGRLAAAVAEERRRLDPTAGPAVRALLAPGAPADLMLIVSRVAVDEPSWPVLAADLGSALRELAGEPVPPARPAPSSHAWLAMAERLEACREPRAARGPGEVTAKGETRTVSRHWGGPLAERMAERMASLPPEDAEAVLAAALGGALLGWTGRDRAVVGVDRDHRRAVPDLADLSGAVGQLGALRPLAVSVEQGGAGEQRQRVRRQLAAAAGDGAEPEIRFRLLRAELPPAGPVRLAGEGWQLAPPVPAGPGGGSALRAVAAVGAEGLSLFLACPAELAAAAESLLREAGKALAELVGPGEAALPAALDLLEPEELDGLFQEARG